METNNISTLIGQLAMKVLEVNKIGEPMMVAPSITLEVFFRNIVLTVFSGLHKEDGTPITDKIETRWDLEVTEEEICRMIDRVNEVADARREAFKQVVLNRIEEEKKKYAELLES